MQEFILKNLITIIFIVLVVCGFLKGFSEGLLKMLLSFGSIIITIVATKFMTPIVASMVKDVTNIESSLTSAIYDSIIKTNIYDGLNIPWLKSAINTGSIESVLRDELCAKIANGIISLLCGIAIFVVVLMLIKLLLKVLDVVDYIPLISQFNKIMGGILGTLQIILIVAILFTILKIFEAIPQVQLVVDNIKDSYIVGYIYNNNIVYNFVSNIFGVFT
ncbi:MAG: CvpA family protein [Lachnospiraceae bacterium]|nr:CvpA family protein [Lachnospiraceae bacterium]